MITIKIRDETGYIAHYGVSAKNGAPGRGSGRYPLGSGANPRSENNDISGTTKRGETAYAITNKHSNRKDHAAFQKKCDDIYEAARKNGFKDKAVIKAFKSLYSVFPKSLVSGNSDSYEQRDFDAAETGVKALKNLEKVSNDDYNDRLDMLSVLDSQYPGYALIADFINHGYNSKDFDKVYRTTAKLVDAAEVDSDTYDLRKVMDMPLQKNLLFYCTCSLLDMIHQKMGQKLKSI